MAGGLEVAGAVSLLRRGTALEAARMGIGTDAPAESLGALEGVGPGTQTARVGFQKQLQVAPGKREVWGGRGAGAGIGHQGAACGRERRLAGLRLTLASLRSEPQRPQG